MVRRLRWLNTVLAVSECLSFAKLWQEKGCSSQAETWQVENILMTDFDWQVKFDIFVVSMATWTIEYNLNISLLLRLYYKPLFGKMSPHSSPERAAGRRAISFVGLSQSCYRLQIFVWQRLWQKLSHQKLTHRMAKRFRRPEDTRRNSRVGRNTTFCSIVCWELFF